MALSSKRTRLTEEALEKVHKLIDSHGGIVKKEEFADIDVDYRRILDFVESGELVRIKNGYYTDRMDRFSEEELIARLFPDACLCMESALYAYGYIRQKPYGWHLAVDKNTSKSRFKMDYPKVIPVLFVTIGFGLVGFLDDYLKVVLHRSDGLMPMQKMALQIVITAIFAFYIVKVAKIPLTMLIPFSILARCRH